VQRPFSYAFLIVCLAVSACATPTPPDQRVAAPSDGFLQIVEPIASGVHVMRQALPNYAGVVGNVTIIEQSNSIVLVDSGASFGDGARVVAAVRALSRKPVSAVIITHWHNDHPLGLAAIVEAWPNVSIISTEATRNDLAIGRTGVPLQADPEWEARRLEQLRGYVTQLTPQTQDPALSQQEREGWSRAMAALAIREGDVAGTHVVLPTRTFTDSLTLPDRRTPIEVRFEGRANTDGDAIVWLPRQRVLITGDTVVWPLPYNFSMYPADNIATLERLRAYDYAALIPGHGEVQRDKSYLGLLIEFTNAVREQVAPLARAGATLEQVTEQLTMESFAHRFAGEDPWTRSWFDNYARAPLIESAYREARGEPLGSPPLTP
jgi:glyoxylase-like metal-dependent hydrolase (beta-lactamase superfamily II)